MALHGLIKVRSIAYCYSFVAAYSLPSSSGRPDSSDMRNSQPKLTHTLKTYAIIVSKLRGEADYRFPVQSRIKVYVTHVEESGNFFWGQVLADVSITISMHRYKIFVGYWYFTFFDGKRHLWD